SPIPTRYVDRTAVSVSGAYTRFPIGPCTETSVLASVPAMSVSTMPSAINPCARPKYAPTSSAAPMIMSAIDATAATFTVIAPETPSNATPPTNTSNTLMVSGPRTRGARGGRGGRGTGGAGVVGQRDGGAHADCVGGSGGGGATGGCVDVSVCAYAC